MTAAVSSKHSLKLNLLLTTDKATMTTCKLDVILSCETNINNDDDFDGKSKFFSRLMTLPGGKSTSSFPVDGKFISKNFEVVIVVNFEGYF